MYTLFICLGRLISSAFYLYFEHTCIGLIVNKSGVMILTWYSSVGLLQSGFLDYWCSYLCQWIAAKFTLLTKYLLWRLNVCRFCCEQLLSRHQVAENYKLKIFKFCLLCSMTIPFQDSWHFIISINYHIKYWNRTKKILPKI